MGWRSNAVILFKAAVLSCFESNYIGFIFKTVAFLHSLKVSVYVCMSQSTVLYLPNYAAGTLGLLCLSLIFYFPSLVPFLFSKSPSDSSVSPLLLYHSVTLSLLVPCSALSLLHSPSFLCSSVFSHHFTILVFKVYFHVPIFTMVKNVAVVFKLWWVVLLDSTWAPNMYLSVICNCRMSFRFWDDTWFTCRHHLVEFRYVLSIFCPISANLCLTYVWEPLLKWVW